MNVEALLALIAELYAQGRDLQTQLQQMTVERDQWKAAAERPPEPDPPA